MLSPDFLFPCFLVFPPANPIAIFHIASLWIYITTLWLGIRIIFICSLRIVQSATAMEHWGVDDVTATLEGEYMQWPLFLFTLYRIDLESSVNVMQQDGVVYNKCVRTLILFKFEEVFHPMCRLGPTQVQCTSTDRGTCMCGECQCKRDQAVSSCS